MERSKSWLIWVGLFFFSKLFAFSYSDRIYNAYIKGDIMEWKAVILELENKNPKSRVLWEELVNYQYGYIGYCIGTGNNTEADIYVRKMEKTLDNPKILQNGLRESYRSAWYAFNIGLNFFKAPILGPKSVEYSKKAIKDYPSCYMGYVQMGNYYLHAPAVFGGDKAEAVRYFSKGLSLLEKEQATRNWNYLNLLSLIARSKYESGDVEGAITVLQKILKIEPNFSWVRNEILPAYLKREKPRYLQRFEEYGTKK